MTIILYFEERNMGRLDGRSGNALHVGVIGPDFS